MSESDKFIYDIILEHISVCDERFSSIKVPSDFVSTKEGKTILDAIATRLQAIGENIKRLLKRKPDLISRYPSINWNEIIQFRDFISHHYELLDYEIVYTICKAHLPVLKDVLEKEISSNA